MATATATAKLPHIRIVDPVDRWRYRFPYMQPYQGTMELSQSNPNEFAALFMSPALVDDLVVRDTVVVADVAAGTMTQADRFSEAMTFFRRVLGCVYLIGSALELGCETVGDAGRRMSDVRARAERLLGFDPLTVFDAEAIAASAGYPEVSPDQPLVTREFLRNLVTSVLATTDFATLLEEARARDGQAAVFDLVGKLNRFLRRIDAFSEQRLLVLADRYAAGELKLAQFAEILGVDQDEVLVRLSQRKPVEPKQRHLYRVPAENEADARVALEEVSSGKAIDLTADELAAWEATGDLPATVEARFAGCHG